MARRPIDPKTLTRNWNELLQELRVAQTGVQILTGFLLTVPFSSRFTDLEQHQVTIYLTVLAGSALTTALVTAPVAFHRILFRRREREWLVEAANVAARAGLTTMALTVGGVLLLVFDIVVGSAAGIIALAVTLVVFGAVWAVVPWWSHRASGRVESEEG
jgi:hypothetical protein